jgi:hypothetical protein
VEFKVLNGQKSVINSRANKPPEFDATCQLYMCLSAWMFQLKLGAAGTWNLRCLFAHSDLHVPQFCDAHELFGAGSAISGDKFEEIGSAQH